MNLFRILGDVSHTLSKCILIWAIHRNSSAEGVSLLTQLLYILVFVNRYLDLFWVPPTWNLWNFVLKIFYISSSAYIVFIMMRVYPRTREKEYGWKLATWSLAGCAVSAPLVALIFRGWQRSTFVEVLYCFSLELESVAVLPQLLLLRQTTVPTVIDSYYLVTLGSYRFFYLLNWLVRALSSDVGARMLDPVAIIFGLIQTALYVDFAWVYYTRQRVKLRGGGVVDSDDLSKSFLVRRIIGRGGGNVEEDEDVWDDEEAGALEGQEQGEAQAPRRPTAPRSGRSWGRRGISVSADDTQVEHDRAARDAQPMADPAAFEDDEEDAFAPQPPAKDAPKTSHSTADRVTNGHTPEDVGSSAEEWQENTGQ